MTFRFRWFAVAIAVCAALVLGVDRPAAAHAQLAGSEPSVGAVLQQAPSRILVRFVGDVEFGVGSIRLYDTAGTLVALGPVGHPGGERAAVFAEPVGRLDDGGYLVAYQVVSADGHTIRGAFSFQVGDAASAPPADLLDRLSAPVPGDGAIRLLSSIGRFLVFSGVAVGVGLIALCVVAWPAGRSDRRARWLAVGAVLTAVVGAVVQLATAAASMAGTGFGGVVSAAGWRAFVSTGVGWWWVARAGLLFALAVAGWVGFSRLGQRRWRVGFGVLALGVFLAMAKSGHGASGRWLWVAAALTVVHLAAISTWVGGVFGLSLVALGRPEGRSAAERFSAIAFVSVVVVVLSGLAQAWRQLPTWADFRDGDYGRTLVTKTVMVLVLIGASGLSRFLVRRPAQTGLRLRDVVGMETLIASGVLLVTTSLVNLPPVPTRAPETVNVSLVAAGRIADVIFEPAAVGPNTVHLTLSSASGVETKPDSMLVRLTLPSSDFGPVSSPPSLAKANHATFSDLILPKAGVWQLEVLVTFGKEQVRFSTPVKVR